VTRFDKSLWFIHHSSTQLFFVYSQTFANGSNCRSHKKKAHPVELAALEASGKSTNATPNIPRLEQLQPKNEPSEQQIITGSNITIQQLPLTSDDMKQDLQPLQIIPHSASETYHVHQIVQTSSPLLSNQMLEPQTQ
jgi:hypothetical protein